MYLYCVKLESCVNLLIVLLQIIWQSGYECCFHTFSVKNRSKVVGFFNLNLFLFSCNLLENFLTNLYGCIVMLVIKQSTLNKMKIMLLLILSIASANLLASPRFLFLWLLETRPFVEPKFSLIPRALNSPVDLIAVIKENWEHPIFSLNLFWLSDKAELGNICSSRIYARLNSTQLDSTPHLEWSSLSLFD